MLTIFIALASALPAVAQYYGCNYHAYYDCQGSAVYWFDSCGNRQDLKINCSTLGQTCQYGQCVTIQLKKPIQPTPAQPAASETPAAPTQTNPSLFVSFFAKKDASATQWDKTTEIGSNGTIYFLATITNSSASQIDNAQASATIPAEIYSVGNLKINDTPAQGDITSGINIGSLKANSTQSITFEGKTQQLASQSSQQASVKITTAAGNQTDSVTINFNPQTSSQPIASVSSAAPSGFWGFLKHWYWWIIIGAVMIFFFVVVFRRLSKST